MMENSTQHSPTVGMHIPAAKRGAYYTLMLALLLLGSLGSNAQYSPVIVTGFTADVIANGTTFPASVTADVDGGSYYFLDSTFTALGNPVYGALPSSGTIYSATTAGLVFQLASASANNSLRLGTNGATGALTFTTPTAAGIVYVLATSGNGASTVNIQVQFTDSTNQIFNNQSLSDWFGGSNYAMWGIGRVNGGGTPPALDNGSNTVANHNPRLYQTALSLSAANYTKSIAYISFTRTNSTNGIPHLMGISIQAPCAAPVNQATALSFSGITTSQISGTFTPAASSPGGYLVVRYPNGATPVAPTNGTPYTVGATIGTGRVESVGTGTTFTSTGLSASTTYTYYIYDYNNTACAGGPAYNTTTPLTASQVTNTCGGTLSGVIPVGPTAPASPAGFATLTAASTYISTNGLGGATTLELQSDYTSTAEIFPITFSTNPCISAGNSLKIRPAASATGLVITGGAAETIDLNGAKYITIDGRPGGTGTTSQLTIINTASAATGVAIRFINDASYNKITYCDIQGQNSGNTTSTLALSGVVFFSTATSATGNGNDNDTLSYCNIHATSAATPAIGISSYGTVNSDATSVGAYNDNNVITNCNIYDFFLAGSASTGIKLDAGNNAWTITNNSIYQTASRAYTTGTVTHRGFWITPNGGGIANTASGFTVTGNYIGGSAPLAAGNAYTMSSSSITSFFAMDISVGLGTATSIANNVITNLSFTASNSSATSFVGISLANGNVDCGVAGSNLIGSATAIGAIQFTTNTNLGGLMGIRTGGGTNNVFNINKNVIAGITVSGSSTSVSAQFAGITAAGGTTVNINNDTIGSLTVANSINIPTAFSGTSTTAYTMQGIWVSAGTTSLITGNVIANLNTNYSVTSSALSSLRGIFVSTGATTITGNTIRNLSSASNTTGNGSNCAIVGIAVTSGTSAAQVVTGNTIHSLNLTGTATSGIVGITGIFMNTSSTLSTVSGNFLHSFNIVPVNNAAVITGFDIGAGRVTFSNNMIRLGLDATGTDITTGVQFRGFTKGTATASNYYYNSVYIGGNNVAGTQTSFAFGRGSGPTSGTVDSVVNNIFVNRRSNTTGTGNHYAISLTASNNTTASLYLNNNVYYADGTNGFFAVNGTGNVPTYTAGWLTGDANSAFADPNFIAPAGTAATVNLHITASTSPAGNAGMPIAAVTTDFDGDTRSTTTPDIGADEFASALPVTLVNFWGQKQGTTNTLYWTTATETNSKGFELQRGIDGNTFTALNTVASKATGGNSSTLLNYQSTDAAPLATDNYYRLKLVDKDGSSTYSSIVLLKGDETNATTVIAVYPNPVADHLNIVITAKSNNKVSLIVNDMNGKQISSQNVQLVPGTNSMQVNTNLLAKGTYAVKIITADGKTLTTSLFVK